MGLLAITLNSTKYSARPLLPLDFKSCSLPRDREPIRLFEAARPVNEFILIIYALIGLN